MSIELGSPEKAAPVKVAAARPSPATAGLRMHLALLIVTQCAAVACGWYPWLAKGLAGLVALGAIFSAPYWLLRGGRVRTWVMAGVVTAGLVAILAPGILWGEAWSHPRLTELIVPQLAALAAILVVRRFSASPVWQEMIGLVIAVGVVMGSRPPAFNVAAPPPLHWLEGGSVHDDEMHYVIQPHSRGVQFYSSNPRNYFRDFGPRGPSHWWAWRLSNESALAIRGRVEISDGAPELVRLSFDPSAPTDAGAMIWQCDHWPFAIGHEITLEFKVSCQEGCKAALMLRNPHASSEIYYRTELEVQPDWQAFRYELPPYEAPNKPSLVFAISGPATIFELSDFHFRSNETEMSVEAPLTRHCVEYQTNELGFRGRDYAIPRPPGLYRIVALGDSFTWGQGVHQEDTFASVLERRLNREATDALQYEVINCGRVGYDAGHERVCYEREAGRYQPNLVLLQLCKNDFEPDSAAAPNTNVNGHGSGAALDPGQRCLAEILRLEQLCRQQGVRLVVMPFRLDDDQFLWRRFRQQWERFAGLEDTPVLWVGEEVLRLARGQEVYAHETDAHPNELAHRLAAEALERFLRDRELLSGTRAK